MRRVLALLLSASLVLLAGCTASYSKRLELTLEEMKYRQALDQHLEAPAEGKLKDMAIFVRPPKPLKQSTEFLLTPTGGLHDLETTFTDLSKPGSLRLHILARRVAPKAAPKKEQGKGAAPEEQAPTVARGLFKADVFGELANDFGATEEQLVKLQDYTTTKKKNPYKHVRFVSPTSGDQIRVYLYENKGEKYDVALIWDIPKGQENTNAVTEAIAYCLDSFAAGRRAQRQFETGGAGDTGGEGEGAPTAL